MITEAGEDEDSHYAYNYLVKYGYMPPAAAESSEQQSSKLQSLASAVTDFQMFAGINVTGRLDGDTMQLMKRRRCGVKDEIVVRTKRFALQGSRFASSLF